MGASANGQLCYGVLYDENYHFPWNDEEYDYEIEDWWLDAILKYTPPFELITATGDLIDNPSQHEYWKLRAEFLGQHPLPVTLVNYCSEETPPPILAVPSSFHFADREYPKKLDIQMMSTSITIKEKEALLSFCEKYCPYENLVLAWYLSGLGE